MSNNEERDLKIYDMRVNRYMTLTAIAKRLGLSRERVRQIVQEVSKKLKEDGNVSDIRATGDR
jgi:DNA-directed RNA polymerase sigma subunit (sigma70/sigma32)